MHSAAAAVVQTQFPETLTVAVSCRHDLRISFVVGAYATPTHTHTHPFLPCWRKVSLSGSTSVSSFAGHRRRRSVTAGPLLALGGRVPLCLLPVLPLPAPGVRDHGNAVLQAATVTFF